MRLTHFSSFAPCPTRRQRPNFFLLNFEDRFLPSAATIRRFADVIVLELPYNMAVLAQKGTTMSLMDNGRTLLCDDGLCQARTDVPIALRSTLLPALQGSAAEGWLFVVKSDGVCHYCPTCARKHLSLKWSNQENIGS